MSELTCKDCMHYVQHYSLDKRKLYRVFCGHCKLFPTKRKNQTTPACENFSPGDADTKAFATKEYLSKELLQYVLEMELLPEITELPAPAKRNKGRG